MADDSGFDLGDVGQAIVALALVYSLQAVENSLTQGKQQDVSQRIPSKLSSSAAFIMVGGYSRTPGFKVMEAVKGNAYGIIQAIHAGRINDILKWYIHSDYVSIDGGNWVVKVNGIEGDGRYIDQKLKLLNHLGLSPETAYSEFASLFSDIWTEDHRGDNTASVAMLAYAPDAKFRQQAFPVGLPILNVVARPGDIYDWRQDSTAGGSGDQRRDDPDTWGPCDNPHVNYVHLSWYRWGMNWDRCIAPVLADLTAEADVCDELVALSGGGTQKRYTCAGWYVDNINRDEVRQKLLASMDGFVTTDGYGHLVLKSGHYEEPDFILTTDYIEDGSTWNRGVSRDVKVSSLSITFTDPGSDYNVVPCDPWVIDEAGGKPSPMPLEWVTDFRQARRLAKRAASRANPAYTGQIRTGPVGFLGMGRRYIRLQNTRESSMADVVCEVLNAELDPITGQFVFDVITADPNIDAWVPAEEEGAAVAAVVRPVQAPLAKPEITYYASVFDTVGEGGVNGVKINIHAIGPDRTDLTWYVYSRVLGAPIFREDKVPDATGGSVDLQTDFVTANQQIEVQVGYTIGNGQPSPRSDSVTVDTSLTTHSLNFTSYINSMYLALLDDF